MPEFPQRACDCSRAACCIVLAIALAACATGSDPRAPARTCSDATLAWAVGMPLDEATYARLLRDSGAGLLNAIGPDRPARADSRTDRLRVYVDRDNRITAARCE